MNGTSEPTDARAYLLEQRADRYLRSPWFSQNQDGPRLYVRASDGRTETRLAWRLHEASTWVEDAKGVAPLNPCSVEEDRACRDDHAQVWVEREGYLNTVWYQREGADAVKVWQAYATAAAPAFARGADGTWVAFHTNLREDTLRPDTAKWIVLRFVSDDGAVWEVDQPMTGRDRDMLGEEQSFEFPALTVSPDGALSIVGRGAHQIWRQDVTKSGFVERAPVGEGGWGCRGRRAAVLLHERSLWVAWRDRKGIRLESSVPASGGAPPLKEACVVLATEAPTFDNPTVDFAQSEGRRTLFGDIHQHSAHSDGIGTADEPYLRARYRYGDDFCALTDHESFLGKRIEPEEWDYLQRIAESHNDPGAFATLLAYEWTGKMHPGPGHKVCYFPERTGVVHSRDRLSEGAQIVATVKSEGGFAVPHHVGWTGADEEAHDEAGQPVWEICSCHGCYEHWAHELGQRGELRDQMVDAVLARGHRFGFIASSDGHGLLWHHGVARKRDPFRTGLTAVQATACTREAIMDAIRARRCYATSGAKIMLNLSVGGVPMGAEANLDGVSVELQVAGTATLKTVELVDQDGVRACWEPPDCRFETRLEVTARNFLYLRVRQQDGEMAWSSPVFDLKTS